MNRPSPRKSHRSPREKTPKYGPLRPDGPGLAKRGLPRWLSLALLAALAVGGFAAAYGLAKLIEHESAPPGMVWVPGGEFTMGTDSDLGWPDEKPAHRVNVGGFGMDEPEVTNPQFRPFVEAPGYAPTAEKPVDAEVILRQMPPGTPAPPKEKLLPGSLVFTPTAGPVDLK